MARGLFYSKPNVCELSLVTKFFCYFRPSNDVVGLVSVYEQVATYDVVYQSLSCCFPPSNYPRNYNQHVSASLSNNLQIFIVKPLVAIFIHVTSRTIILCASYRVVMCVFNSLEETAARVPKTAL